ncbi:MAG: FadR/GntR family transcriptional regulator [Bacteroidota bacterium]|jgi:GntR family transcriptional repressor for pyruvate dehydrogenase complex|nr:FadR family transcriptional regulator [Prolixibacteraceae bacterium]MDI9564777.1 FadR/GntR family transcriptional regulator [Bacteroidota bacterium]NLS99054.1 FadR family transcriptional regulator [Bacteroidales bacterium]HNZ69211.1 FadR/GntR family transcriptional regulator [Prolixibacteraceae bacterium]HOC85569.1 FadR/GntR family transcriptional regulator [Prolixibacteraceae bacterium]
MEEIFGKISIGQTLSQKIERKIEEAIRQKKLVPGAKLPSERELCESFAVSRTALREALRRLSARGLINVRKGSGMFVSEINIEDTIKSLNLYYDLKFDSNLISQIIEVRRLFEPEIARLAARNHTEEDISILRDNITDLINCDPDNTQQEVDVINRFHLNLSKATGNPIIMITMEPIYNLLPRMRNLIYGNIEGEKEYTLRLQQNILDAVEHGDGQNAYRFSVELLERNMEVYNKYFKD